MYFSFGFSNNARAATGKVVSVSANYSDGSITYQPTIAFIDAQGAKQTGETSYSYSCNDPPPANRAAALAGFGAMLTNS